MKNWKTFWDGLNIRKALALYLITAYVAYMFITNQDLGIKDLVFMVAGYWFGYSNGQKTTGLV